MSYYYRKRILRNQTSLQKLQSEEQNKLQASRSNGLIQIEAEINDIDKRIQRKSMKPKRGPLRGSIKLIVV